MDVTNQIMELIQERGWSEYRLVKESGLSASTIWNIFHHNAIPNIITLEYICNALGISLSQFFAEGDEAVLTEEQEKLLGRWAGLSEKQKRGLLDLMTEMAK